MKIENVNIADLVYDPKNARKHDDKNLEAIMGSLKTFGQRKPIVVNKDNVIVAGNGTIEAAKRLSWDKIDVVRIPEDWSADHTKAFALADNRTAELASWNAEVLTAQLRELEFAGFEVAEFGFDFTELNLKDNVFEDETPDVNDVPNRVALGDIWKLGNHRLMCGDSTNLDNVEKLMAGSMANMVLTDPPYGVNYQSNGRVKSKKFDVLKNDDVILNFVPAITHFSKGWIFVWTSWKVINKWIDALAELGYPSNMIIWNKGGGGLGDLKKTFASDYEIALVWNRENDLIGKRHGSVWDIGKDSAVKYLHPTQKPIALSVQAIEATTKKNDLVLDLFAGSGSTLIACEQIERVAYVMELDSKYCDVILKRWENITGLKAELIQD